jgi:hypothetical protein
MLMKVRSKKVTHMKVNCKKVMHMGENCNKVTYMEVNCRKVSETGMLIAHLTGRVQGREFISVGLDSDPCIVAHRQQIVDHLIKNNS